MWGIKHKPIPFKPGIDFSSIKYIFSETIPNKKLEEALARDFNTALHSTYYYYNKVDIDDDGNPEVFVLLAGQSFCGTGGCSAAIYKETVQEYTLFSQFALVRNPIIISNTKTNGCRDIIMYNSGGGIKNFYYTWIRYDGIEYPRNPSVEPKVMPGTKVEGIAIIADDTFKIPGIELKPFVKSALTNEIGYTVTKFNYLKTNSNMKLEIKYPQINGLADKYKQNRINTILKDEALKVLKYYGDSTGSLDLNIDYKITLMNENILSIQYSGLGYVSHAAYPNNLFYTTNIDMKTGKRLRLKDIVNINDNFANKFLNGEFKTYWPQHSEAIKNYSIETIEKYFKEADSLDNIGTDKQSDVFSYLTNDSLGISVSVGHALGDHAEFEIKYEDIKDNIIYKII